MRVAIVAAKFTDDEADRLRRSMATFRNIGTIGEHGLKFVKGRRAVVILSDGRDENNPGTGPGSVHTFTDVLNAIRGVDAMVFPIGLGNNLDRAYLERMGELSMGEAYFPADVTELDANYTRILENLRRRYVISYTSTNDSRDGAWRKVEIKSLRDGVVVESRGGYFAPNK